MIVLNPRKTLFLIASLPVVAVLAWFALGLVLGPAGDGPALREAQPEQVRGGVARLADRLKQGPATAADWELLARSQAALRNFREAADAYGQALRLSPGSAQLHADRADVLLAIGGGPAFQEADAMLKEAFRIDPVNVKALAVAGTLAFDRGQFEQARAYWRQARLLSEPGSDFAIGLERGIAQATERMPASVKAPARRD